MSTDEVQVDGRDRVDRWISESQEVLGRIIPGVIEDRQHQGSRAEAAERACKQLELEANDLRRELGGLHTEVRTLKSELVEIGYAASALASHLNRAIVPLVGLRHTIPVPAETPPAPPAEVEPAPATRRIPAKKIALIAAGAIGALALVLGVGVLAPVRREPPAPAPTARPEVGAVSEPTPLQAPGPPAALPSRREPAPLPRPAARAKPTVLPENLLPTPRNEIRNFRAVEGSGRELRVTVDYAYIGDHSTSEIFMHAVALERDEWKSRVPGTGFPYSAIAVGDGTVTINISKQPDTPPATSTVIKVCMVSIKKRAAFMCETFPYTKAWES
jgi:hypothetical protein